MEQELRTDPNKINSQSSVAKTSLVQWNMTTLLTATFVCACFFGLPLAALAWSLPVFFCTLFSSVAAYVFCFVVAARQESTRADNFFRSLLSGISLIALIGLSVSSAVLWVRITFSDNPAEAWNTVLKVLQTI